MRAEPQLLCVLIPIWDLSISLPACTPASIAVLQSSSDPICCWRHWWKITSKTKQFVCFDFYFCNGALFMIVCACICWYFLNCCPDSGSVASPDMLAASATRERVDIEINIGNLQRLYLFLGMRVENGCGISRKCKLTKKSWLFISKNSIWP